MKRNGLVSWFSDPKGYGFITDEAEGFDVFVHYSQIRRKGFLTLAPGERVRYELKDQDAARKAEEVEILG
jgi:CspA family cold shock protein